MPETLAFRALCLFFQSKRQGLANLAKGVDKHVKARKEGKVTVYEFSDESVLASKREPSGIIAWTE